jgi:hypothetical protein
MVKGIVLAKGPFVPKGQVVMHMPTDANKCVKSTAQHFQLGIQVLFPGVPPAAPIIELIRVEDWT